MPILGSPLPSTVDLSQILRPALDRAPTETALISVDERLDYAEVDRRSSCLAANLLALGLRPGDRVASLMPNRPELLLHYLACLKAGLVATPLNYRFAPPEIDHALEVSGARLLVAHAERRPDLAQSRLTPNLPLGQVQYGAKAASGAGLEELLERVPRDASLPPVGADSPAFIFFTSGSTGLPKGVTHTQATFGSAVAVWAAGMDLAARDVVLPASSISHIAGLLLSLAGLAVGGRVLVARTSEPADLLPLLRNERPTVLCMLPAPLFALVRDHGATHADFTSLRLCIAGGDKVSAELEREFSELAGLAIDECYGMTETGCAAMSPPTNVNKLGSVGRPLPGIAFSLRGPGGNEVPTGEEGRLWVQSPANMVGYWGQPDATAETIRDGWLDTGDVMTIDGDGYLWFHGRQKQIIVHDGSNISPQEVEEAIAAHPAIELVGVIGVRHPLHGETVRAYVSLIPDAKRPTALDLISFCRQRIAAYKAPEEIIFLDAVPLNATGKVDRVALKRLAEQAQAGVPHTT